MELKKSTPITIGLVLFIVLVTGVIWQIVSIARAELALKADVSRVSELEIRQKEQSEIVRRIEERLIRIETKVDILLKNKGEMVK